VAFRQIWRRPSTRRPRSFKRVAGGDEPSRMNAGSLPTRKAKGRA